MAKNRLIETTQLDFDKIKENLKLFMQGQDQFSDYDFEGSGLSILLDLLAYNTHYNALYTNLAVNEAFLDSASKRTSVVSKARELGYLPTSAKCAMAEVSLLFINNNIISRPDVIEIPRNAVFSCRVNDQNYDFYTTESYIAYRSDNEYRIDNVKLREGAPLLYQFNYAPGLRMVLPNANIDLSTLRVLVQDTATTSQYEIYTNATSVLNLDGNSKVYFVREMEEGLYEVEFGNGIIGKPLAAGNFISIEYQVSSTTAANGARQFRYNGTLPSETQVFVTTTVPAFGGSDPEDIESIKWNAPRMYAAQYRAVTIEDYRTIIKSLYPNARSINVWGGEQNIPPAYGDVYISIQPESADVLTEAEKSYILNDLLASRNLVTIHPKIVDPTLIQVQLTTAFYYNPNETLRSASDLTALVYNSILIYNNSNLNQFGGIMKYSALSRAIDEAEPAITNSITTLKLHREVPIQYNQAVEYTVDLGNPIYNSGVSEESVISTGLNVLNIPRVVYIDDVPTEGSDTGTLRMYYVSGGQKITVRNVGTVQYSTGILKIKDLIITGAVDNVFKFIIKPQSNDVASIRNQIVAIDPQMVTITPLIDRAADKYTFASSRN